MRPAIVGAGPTGLYMAVALARRGRKVTVVDRDPGPDGDATWDRQGVMQFHHPHGFRQQVWEALLAEMPDVAEALLAAGAVPRTLPGQPDRVVGLGCRRVTFERVLRAAAQAQPGIALCEGHCDEVVSERGRAVGLRVDGQVVDADFVLDASGRAGRLSRAFRRPAESGDCGISYVSRQYQMLPGAQDGPTNSPIGMVAAYCGYLAIVFLHDNRTLSTLIARASRDQDLAALRLRSVFEAAAGAIPALAAWTDPARSRPITEVLPGGRLQNTYNGQVDEGGRVALDGLIFAGDAVCTTNPSAGRGVATSLLQAQHLVGLLDEHGRDFTSCSLAFDSWCHEQIKPWFHDHVDVDEQLTRRWAGGDIDLTRPLPSDLIVAATEAAPEMMNTVGPYLTMQALPDTLRAAEPRARDIYATGWRPPEPDGPTRDELVDVLTRTR